MADLTEIANVIADGTRMRMLEELLGGVPLTPGSLAMRVGVAPSTVSGHLARLEDAGLVEIEPVGRSREVTLAGPDVAHALEALAALADSDPQAVGLREVNKRTRMRRARSCYDHLAGQLGVAVFDALVARGAVATDGARVLDDAGFAAFGVDLTEARAGRRALVRSCRDWTERRTHLAGAAGAATLDAVLAQGWVVRASDSRTLLVTGKGEAAFDRLGVAL